MSVQRQSDIWDEIVSKTRRFIWNAGFEQVVFGLSGGIDSAVVACIASAAVGKQHKASVRYPKNKDRAVSALLMPSPYSSQGSIDDSLALAVNWGFATRTIPITPLMSSFDNELVCERKEVYTSGLTEENLQARIRAVLLMWVCNEQHRLLLNTCNKSEDWTGYCTLYGDSCGAVAPIGDLYKTEVYALVRWINSNPDLPDIPVEILEKEPSAELSDGQRDTDTLPPYDVLDGILRLRVDHGWSADQIATLGPYDIATVTQVCGLVAASAFKRQQSPPVIPLDQNKGNA